MSAEDSKPLGFWSCWALTVGCMIGSGIFMLPTVLAPYGMLSFGGWLLSGAGSILIALVFARLASRTTRTGGPYAYVHDAFGDVFGFANAWGYWVSYWTGIPAIIIAFTGYLGVFIPALNGNVTAQALTGLGMIWALTLVNIRGVRDSGLLQLAMTVLKLIPLFIIIALGAAAGTPDNLPAVNPQNAPLLPTIAAVALLTMWAFLGIEVGAVPAGSCHDCQRTIPRAIIIGTITVTFVYLASTAAVMMLVPPHVLAQSTSPFADAARHLGTWGPSLIAAGALVSTAGSANGNIFVSGQLPMAVALDKLAPRILGVTNRGGAPYVSLLISATIASIFLVTNYSRGLIGAFTFLVMVSTVATLLPYLFSAAAELRYSWRSARGWAGVALLAGLYTLFAIIGSGLEVLTWGTLMFLSGIPLYYLAREKKVATAPSPS
jgi:APA family basic amino acid/polyamine antiporter